MFSEEQRGMARLDSDTTDPTCRQDLEAAHIEGLRATFRMEAVAAPAVRWLSRTLACAVTAGAPLFAAWLKERLRRHTPHQTRVNTMDVSHNVGQGTVIIHHVIQQHDREVKHDHEAASLFRSHPCALLRKFIV